MRVSVNRDGVNKERDTERESVCVDVGLESVWSRLYGVRSTE